MTEKTETTADEATEDAVAPLPMTDEEIFAELEVLMERLGADKVELIVERGDDRFDFEWSGDDDGEDDDEPVTEAAE